MIDKILNNISALPTLPTVYSVLSEAMEDPNTSPDKLAKIISSDQASVFKILKVANSPFFGFHGRIDTISQAILYLGFNEVRNIVFALSVINFFSKDKILLHFRPVDFWAHSIGTGIATRMIGQAAGEKKLENYFLAGIFHDIGKLVFFEFANKEYVEVLDIVENKNCRIKDAELEIFGMDHARVGQLLAEKWKLPPTVKNAVFYHHAGVISNEENRLVASVHVGNIVARTMELGYAGDNIIPEPNLKVWEILKLPNNIFTQIRKKLKDDFDLTIRIMLVD